MGSGRTGTTGGARGVNVPLLPSQRIVSRPKEHFYPSPAPKLQRGLSPLDVRATVGSSPYGREAAAALAGRSDITVPQLGNLASRANIGQLPQMRVGGVVVPSVQTNLLNLAGKKVATGILDRLVSGGTPETRDGFIQGVTDTEGKFFGRADVAPSERGGETSQIKVAPEPVETVQQFSGSGLTSTKAARGSGRRKAFGTRTSLLGRVR